MISNIVGRGFGPGGSIAYIVTRGYGTSSAPPPLPTGGGGAYPDDRRKKKSNRPIWDKGWGALSRLREPADVSAPAASPPSTTPLAEITLKGGKPDLTNLTRIFLPEFPKPIAEPARVYHKRAFVSGHVSEADDAAIATGRAAVSARAEIADDHDSGTGSAAVDVAGHSTLNDLDAVEGRGTIGRIIATARGIEDHDRVSAKASWNDDDLLLEMIANS